MATVVVVDDSPTAVALLETVLRYMGHRVMSTHDSRAALALVKQHRPNLLIADIFMPAMDGYTLVEKIRADRDISATPVILWTASYVASKVRPIASRLAVKTVLTKPCEPQELMAAINTELMSPVDASSVAPIPEALHLQHLEDVTARLNEEVTAERTQVVALMHELEETSKRNQLLFDNHPMPMFIFDVSTSAMLEVNEAALWKYGYAREEFLGLTAGDILPAEILSVRPDGSTIQAGGPSTHKNKDGISFDADTMSYDLAYEGRPARFVTVEDVTEKRQLERRLEQSQRLESLGQLAGGVAHDFNNLLAVILNYTQFVKRKVATAVDANDGSQWKPVVSDLEKIERATQNAARLTRQLLTFARLDGSQPRPTDVNAVLRETEQLLRRTIGEHIDLVVNSSSEPAQVLIDPGQLGQVITNLAVNARDAMPGGGTLTFETGIVSVDDAYRAGNPSLKPGKHVEIRITDTGTGMSADALQHVFEPFFTTKAPGHGTGLGLSTVHGIVTKAGGQVSISSQADMGTRVNVLLPATDAVPTPEPALEQPDANGTGTVLVVEDEAELREIIQRILTRRGYEVLIAANGPEAIARANRYPGHIDLLLTDVVMPRMPGTELASHLDTRRPGLHVLFMSGYAEPLLGPSSTLDPSVMLLEKPFTEPTLLAKVARALTAG